MPNVTLFLGAGASRAFGYPTTADFLKNLRRLDHGHKTVLDGLLRSPQIQDIEHVLQILDILITADSNPYLHANFSKYQPKMPIGAGHQPWAKYITNCRGLKDRIMTELHKQYEFDPDGYEKLFPVYQELLNTVIDLNDDKKLDIFTTNYDSVIEEVSLRLRLRLVDGFSYDAKRKGRFWEPALFEQPTPFTLRLFKLHGSLNWRETHHGKIESMRGENRYSGTRRYRKNILIYPTQKGLEGEEPFATLFKYFRNSSELSDGFLIIGFSFRDPLINDIFLNNLRINVKHKLIVFSPTATENVINNLLVKARGKVERDRLERQVQCLNAKFGEHEALNLIENTLKGKRKKTKYESQKS